MEKEYKKVDETLEVIESKTETKTASYQLPFLKTQLQTVQDQKDRDNALRDAEIAELETLIAKCAELGIVEKEDEKIIEE
jgi:hypothetical protein